MFLGILTSRYSENDFLISFPRKLVIGLSTLFISVAAMMVAFCAALRIVMDGRLEVVIPVSLLAGIPVTLFILLEDFHVHIWTRYLQQENEALVLNIFVFQCKGRSLRFVYISQNS
jgi:hypothetical protein